MKISKLTQKIITLGLTATLSSGVTFWYYSSRHDEEIIMLKEKIHILEENERNAIVTKRISEQMEDIAYQQMNIADSARNKAIFESENAKKQAQRAEQERHNALIAKDLADKAEAEARKQADKAERESFIAQLARDSAVTERAKADTLRYISLGRSLAQTSIAERNTGNYDLAQLLSYAAYTYTTEYGASPYQQEVFTSVLNNTPNATLQLHQFTGNINTVLSFELKGEQAKMDDDLLVATDYGEVAYLTPKYNSADYFLGFDTKMLLQDNNFFFTTMCQIGNMAYALDVNGRLVALDITKGRNQKPQILDLASPTRASERWFRLLKKKDGTIIAVGEHQLCWVDLKHKDKKGEESMFIYNQHYIPEEITEAGIGDGKLLVFTKHDKFFVFMAGEPAEWKMELPKSGYVTSYYFYKEKKKGKTNKYHVLGTNNGSIYLYDLDGGEMASFTGHTGAITHMEHLDWCFVTSSYDKTLSIWNLENLGDLVVPINIQCPAWPLSFALDHKVQGLRVGYAGGVLRSLRISLEANSNSIHKHLDREFTDKEWDYYIGKDVPYRRFKEQ